MLKDIVYTRGYMAEGNQSWSWKFDCMEDFDIWFVRDGRGVFSIGGMQIALTKGLCLIIPPGMAGSACQDKDAPLRTVAAHFLFTGSERISLPLFCWIDDVPFFEGLMIHSVRCCWADDKEGATHWLRCILDELSHSISGARGLRPREEEIETLCRKIALEPERQWKVGDLAKQAFLCRERFSRVFSQTMGVSPHEFIIQTRLDKARAMLNYSGLSIAEIAKACGYSSEFFFSRQFKQRTGFSPSTMRKALKSSITKAADSKEDESASCDP